MPIRVNIAHGEFIDKITILELKLERITDPAKLDNVRVEYDLLMEVYRREITTCDTLRHLNQRLKEINGRLWAIEDEIRSQERAKTFGDEFVRLARLIYRTNDERAAVKREINKLCDSTIVEEKSYAPY
jgi:hypothetical protein